ncbi:hypothetical protein HOG21_04445 [bacterium]|nr:hypothetical protein [bacterium]
MNKQIDKKLIGDLTTQINKDFDKIKNVASIEIKNNLNIEDKKELYNKLLTEYQKLNFAKPNNKELYATKIELKTKLITLSSNEDKKILVNSTLYDFKDILDSRSYAELEKTIKVLYDNKESL